MSQQGSSQPLSSAPKDIRIAAAIALLSGSAARAVGILSTTAIFALLPTWVPGILSLQPLPVGLLVLTVGSYIVARMGFHNRERIAAGQYGEARSSGFLATILGLTVGGVIPGVLSLLLYLRVGGLMVKRTTDQPATIYLLPKPSGGLFLGRYLGWLTAYFLVLYLGYTQLPPGLGSVNGWLSPVLGVHFNTMIVATYLVFANPLTYPPLLQIWATVGFLGGLIAGGHVRRGFTVGLTTFISALGAIGLASLAITRGFSLFTFLQVPPPPPGFSLGSVATGPVAKDLIPIFLQTSSFTDTKFIQDIVLTLLRNALLVVSVVTIAGRLGCLVWQGGVFLANKTPLRKSPKEEPEAKPEETKQVETDKTDKTLKVGVLLILLAIPFLFAPSQPGTGQAIFQASSSGPYQENMAVSLNMLGAPNSSLRLTNLDLSSRGLILDRNYDNNSFTALIINNNFPQAFGLGPQSFALQLFSEPTLVMLYTTPLASARARADAVATQYSRALGVTFTLALALPYGLGVMLVYSPSPGLSNADALQKALAVLPATSFSSLINPANVTGQRYFAMLGVLPKFTLPGLSVTIGGGFSFILNVQFPRQFYKEGPHHFSLKTLLGFTGSITRDPAANVSLVTLTFQRKTTLYSPLGPNPYYINSTSTYYLNATQGPAPDLIADFAFPFAPNIVVEKIVSPSVGNVGSTRTVAVTVRNLDTVSVNNLNVTDPQTSSPYQATLQLSANSPIQVSIFIGGDKGNTAYTATPASSGTYVLSPATATFLWTASNGTRIRYSVSTDEVVLTSESGPTTQFTRTIDDLWPYSILVLLSLIVTPVLQMLRRLRRSGQRKSQGRKTKPSPEETRPTG